MQQPGLQQAPAGWPGIPGLQAPPQSTFASPAPPQGAPPFMPMPQQVPLMQVPLMQAPQQAQSAQPAFQPQAAPVPPVAYPQSPYSGGQAHPVTAQSVAQSAAQAAAKQVIDTARTLEQLMPAYQLLLAVVAELPSGPTGGDAGGRDEAVRGLKDAFFHHGAALGFIRRLLCGELTPSVLTNLALATQRLQDAHVRFKPSVERVLLSSPIGQSAAVSLIQAATARSDAFLAQAVSGIQGIVGPQAWEAARVQSQA